MERYKRTENKKKKKKKKKKKINTNLDLAPKLLFLNFEKVFLNEIADAISQFT